MNILKRILKKFRTQTESSASYGFFGDYASWSLAMADCSGYDQESILQKSISSIQKVKDGEAAYERDTVLFDEVQYSWPVLAGLLRAALENNGTLSVVDFGGALGSSYFQNREFLSGIKSLHWTIVEQENYARAGNEHFQSHELLFTSSLSKLPESIKKVNVVLLSSSLPYMEKPYSVIEEVKSVGAEYLIVDRTYFWNGPRDRLTKQIVPDFIYQASYPAWFFNEAKFVSAFGPEYELLVSFPSYLDAASLLRDSLASEKGFIFRKK